MSTDSSKEKILSKITAASKGRTVFVDTNSASDKQIYKPILPDVLSCFKNELETINGTCIICENEAEVYSGIQEFMRNNNLESIYCRDTYISGQLQKFGISCSNNPDNFISMQAGITGCEFLIARTGSVMVSSASESCRQMNVFPPVHIILAHASQLVNYVEDAMIAIQNKYADNLPSSISTISGPSRTADIEKTLVLGAHGPKELLVFLSKE